MARGLGKQYLLNLEPFTLASSEFCCLFEANILFFSGREVMLGSSNNNKNIW